MPTTNRNPPIADLDSARSFPLSKTSWTTGLYRWGAQSLWPMTLLINLTRPVPARTPHIDTAGFRGVEFRQYSAAGFSWEEQVRTAHCLARHGGPVVLSNQATDRIVELYESLGFTLKFLAAHD